VRPVAGWIGLARGRTGPTERGVIAFFGVRGIGSLFYLAFALSEGEFADPEGLWGTVALVVIGSVVLHGVVSTPAMRRLDRARQAVARDRGDDVETTPV
jgi:sodium/hydrogen antiporter